MDRDGERPPCDPWSVGPELLQSGLGADPDSSAEHTLCWGFPGKKYSQESVKRCLTGPPALDARPLLGRPGSVPRTQPSALSCVGLGSCQLLSLRNVVEFHGGFFLHPLANCCIIHLVCHQSVSVYCSFFPMKTTQNKALLLKCRDILPPL